jgi:hypothetical protein
MAFPGLTSAMGGITAGSAQSKAEATANMVNANADAANKEAAKNKMIADWQNEEKAAIQGAA